MSNPRGLPSPLPATPLNLASALPGTWARCSSQPFACAGEGEDELSTRWVKLHLGEDSEPGENATIMPVFPLASCIPYTKQVLSIYEPRYRQLYNDILFNGARRFMVTNWDGNNYACAEVGVIFYLDDLKEVSEQTGDQVKYICEHSLIGRVKLLKVLNPREMLKRSTYLRAEVEILEDSDDIVDTAAVEADVRKVFEDIVDLQQHLGEQPRLVPEQVKHTLGFQRKNSTDGVGLWDTIATWHSFLETRVQAKFVDMNDEIKKEVYEFLVENPITNTEDQLPESLQSKMQDIQQRHLQEIQMMHPGAGDFVQAMLQTTSHEKRLHVFRDLLEKERERLNARALLKKAFKD